MSKVKIVLDSNIYIAAFLAKGLALEILELGYKEKIEIYTSNEILREVKGKLVGKLKLEESYVDSYIKHLSKGLKVVIPLKKLHLVKPDPDDNKILECAEQADANLIVSIDKHLLKIKKFGRAGIVHPKTLTWIIPNLFKKSEI